MLYLLWTVWTNQVSLFTTVSQLILTIGFVLWFVYDIRKKWDWSLWLLLMVAVLAVGILFSWAFWDFLHGTHDSPAGPTISSLGLLIGGAIAAILAVWRSIVAERQADTAQRQADAAQRQANTAQQSLLNERYQKGAEMLGSQVLEVRLGGIYALQDLAEGHPEEYHVRIMRLLSTFVRNPNRDRLETSEVMSMVNDRSEQQLALERDARFYLDLRRANLKLLHVSADLSRAILWGVDISLASIHGSQLSDAMLANADLSGTVLSHSDLSGAAFRNTRLSGTDFTGGSSPDAKPVTGLTQEQLTQACADPDNPPKLDGVRDAETGKPLVWRCKPCEDD